MQHVEVHKQIAVPIETVWERYTDHLSWARWAGLGKVRLARKGAPSQNGAGCVRVFSTLGFEVHEEVLEFEPPHRMTYRLVKGAVPMRDHLGEVVFEARDGGTWVTWRCQFESTLPLIGSLSQAGITMLFSRALDALARDLSGGR